MARKIIKDAVITDHLQETKELLIDLMEHMMTIDSLCKEHKDDYEYKINPYQTLFEVSVYAKESANKIRSAMYGWMLEG